MTKQEAIELITNAIQTEKLTAEQDKALAIVQKAVKKQIEIENTQFSHICQSDRELYPTAFSIFARVVNETKDSVEIERFQKFGALPLRNITISKKDFKRFYREIEKQGAIE